MATREFIPIDGERVMVSMDGDDLIYTIRIPMMSRPIDVANVFERIAQSMLEARSQVRQTIADSADILRELE